MTTDLPSHRLRDVVEPLAGQVYFSPECHARYVELGFRGSPGRVGIVALPDGPSYFVSRASSMGQVPWQVVAATFAVFEPETVRRGVTKGWSLTDAASIQDARQAGGTDQLRRILGPAPVGLTSTLQMLERIVESLPLRGCPLFAGLCSMPAPDDDIGRLFLALDCLREHRGDVHVGTWMSRDLDPIEAGLMNELRLEIPMGTYTATRGWTIDAIEAATERLRSRGLVEGGAFTPRGHEFRSSIEDDTDRPILRALVALDDAGLESMLQRLEAWAMLVISGGGFPASLDMLDPRPGRS